MRSPANKLTYALLGAVLIPISGISARAAPFQAQVFEIGSNHQKLLYTLIRKESGPADKLKTNIVFKDPSGKEVVREAALVSNGHVVRYSMEQLQLGEVGSLEVSDGKARFSFTRNGKTETSEEDAVDNLITGPTTMDFLERHWKELLAGETVSSRFAVIARKETVGFKFFKEAEEERGGRRVVRLKMKPTSIVIAALVDPLVFWIDRETVHLVEVRGRTLPMARVGDRWKDLDAEILYRY
jgi:hypothetical protein